MYTHAYMHKFFIYCLHLRHKYLQIQQMCLTRHYGETPSATNHSDSQVHTHTYTHKMPHCQRALTCFESDLVGTKLTLSSLHWWSTDDYTFSVESVQTAYWWAEWQTALKSSLYVRVVCMHVNKPEGRTTPVCINGIRIDFTLSLPSSLTLILPLTPLPF